MANLVSRRTFLTLSGALVLAGCASPAATPTAAPAKPAAAAQAPAQTSAPATINVLSVPSLVVFGMIWAQDQGFYKELSLDVTTREFPSGTTAAETFRTGQGDLLFSGDLPGLTYWANNQDYKVILPIERNDKGYIIMSKTDISAPRDFAGKKFALRIGSTMSFFASKFIEKNGLAKDSISLVNLDTNQLVPALDKGDIDGFFASEPSGIRAKEASGDRVKYFGNAVGLMKGYTMFGARATWLATNQDPAKRFVQATYKGLKYGLDHPEETKQMINKRFNVDRPSMDLAWDYEDWIFAFDQGFYTDFQAEADWALGEKLMSRKLDFTDWVWTDGVASIDAARAMKPPAA